MPAVDCDKIVNAWQGVPEPWHSHKKEPNALIIEHIKIII